MAKQSETPLVLIAFNRPNLLRKQLEIVQGSFKGPIYAIIDGPRSDRAGEIKQVEEVAELLERFGGNFELYVNRCHDNLGCYQRIKSGLDWVFSRVDRAIILEDDCMPNPQFFTFAAEMLMKYADDDQLYSVSGTNLFPSLSPPDQTYFFSRYHNCWGWATWARAWQHFIDDEAEWRKIRNSRVFLKSFRHFRSYLYWRKIFDLTYQLRINSWFYRWMLTCWVRKGFCIVPERNLITNLGDGEDASHTAGFTFLNRDTGSITSAIQHPPAATHVANNLYDKELEDKMYSKSTVERMKWIANRVVKNLK